MRSFLGHRAPSLVAVRHTSSMSVRKEREGFGNPSLELRKARASAARDARSSSSGSIRRAGQSRRPREELDLEPVPWR